MMNHIGFAGYSIEAILQKVDMGITISHLEPKRIPFTIITALG